MLLLLSVHWPLALVTQEVAPVVPVHAPLTVAFDTGAWAEPCTVMVTRACRWPPPTAAATRSGSPRGIVPGTGVGVLGAGKGVFVGVGGTGVLVGVAVGGGGPPQRGKRNVPTRVGHEALLVTWGYSVVYQKVQSS